MLSRCSLTALGLFGILFAPGAVAAPAKRNNPPTFLEAFDTRAVSGPLMPKDFPDPAIVQDKDGQWYAFATAGNGKHVQMAKSPNPNGPWSYIEGDALPNVGSWADAANTWAPDVRRIGDGRYVLYYSGQVHSNPAHHCVGTAVSNNILGPYQPSAAPLACPLDRGGAIDPSGYFDSASNKHYVVYKIDGNSIGHGGSCNNGVEPIVPTPIMLQELAADGISPVGAPVQIMDRTPQDGPLIEAPNLVRTQDGTYVIFFSSHCYDSPEYNVNYATSKDIRGPYARTAAPLIKTGNFGWTAPGGATSIEGGGKMVLHANCAQGRCMVVADYGIKGSTVIVS